MTLREVITEKRKEFWRDSDSAQMGEELELIIDRIDKLERDLDNVRAATVHIDNQLDILINKESCLVPKMEK